MKDLPNVERILCEPTEPLVTATGLQVGSITFPPSQSNPLHDPALVIAQAEVERLRAGNRRLMDENNELRRQLNAERAL